MSPLSVVVWICVAVFLVTAFITFAALLGWIRCLGGGDCSRHHYYVKCLFWLLIAEIVGTSTAAYAGALNSKDRDQLTKITEEIRTSKPEIVSQGLHAKGFGVMPIPQEQVLQQKAYVTSDGPSIDEKVVMIPDGWRYIEHTANVWTKNGDATFTVTPLKNARTKEITALKLTANAGDRKWLGSRNWVGVDLNIAMGKKL